MTKISDFKDGDRVRSTKWGKMTEGPYIGLTGTVVDTRPDSDYVRVKLDNDPVVSAENCTFFPSELQIINEKVGATN